MRKTKTEFSAFLGRPCVGLLVYRYGFPNFCFLTFKISDNPRWFNTCKMILSHLCCTFYFCLLFYLIWSFSIFFTINASNLYFSHRFFFSFLIKTPGQYEEEKINSFTISHCKPKIKKRLNILISFPSFKIGLFGQMLISGDGSVSNFLSFLRMKTSHSSRTMMRMTWWMWSGDSSLAPAPGLQIWARLFQMVLSGSGDMWWIASLVSTESHARPILPF